MAKTRQKVKRNINSREASLEISESFSLLESPEEIAKFQKVLPNAPERLFTIAEKEQDFRHEFAMRRLAIVEEQSQTDNKQIILGTIFGFIIFMSAMCFSAFLIYCNHVTSGTIFAGTTLLSGAALFVRSRISKDNVKKIPEK